MTSAAFQSVDVVRLCADEHGSSHFTHESHDLVPVTFAPPAPPLNLASPFPAASCFFLAGPGDWGGDVPHPTPRRQLFCFLQGELDVTASDGEARRFRPGDVLLLEDTTGAGHATRVVGGRPFLILGVALTEEASGGGAGDIGDIEVHRGS